jgi:hypothetical protein
MYGVCMVFSTGKSQNIRSYTAHIYGSGQPYEFTVCVFSSKIAVHAVKYGYMRS